VAAIENTAGYFTMPDAYDAAVALTQAQINYDENPADCPKLGFNTSPCYLLENLSTVYTYNDPRTYPLSSYSYEILPTSSSDPTVNTAKRQALANFDTIALCQGQAQMAPIGYSPLPVNLVQASFQQVGLLNKADPSVDVSNVDVSKCNNPTFISGKPNQNYLAQIAPYPPTCAKAGAGPCPGQYAHNGNPVNGQAAKVTTTPGLTPSSGGHSSGAGPESSGSSGGGNSTGISASNPSGSASGGAGSGNSATARSGGSLGPATSGSAGPTAAGGGGGTNGSGAASGSANDSTSSNVVPLAAATVLGADHPGSGSDLFIQAVAVIVIVLVLAAPAVLPKARRTKRAKRAP
jgi:phosphate transport system substrate-binding protein